MEATPKANRLHIGLFGQVNAGKSSLINSISNQEIAIVAAEPGTTTDPVYRTMELLPLGPVVLIDTAGLEDTTALGEQRIKRTQQILRKIDLALLVCDATQAITSSEVELAAKLRKQGIPYIWVLNKTDLLGEEGAKAQPPQDQPQVLVSATKGEGIGALKELIIRHAPQDFESATILGDLVAPGQTVVMVIPIDSAAPKGRLILPQVQAIRDALDHGAIPIMTRESELTATLAALQDKPQLIVTDSQAFNRIKELVPKNVPFTGFSLLFARYKGEIKCLTEGLMAIHSLQPGDKVLIAEACSHHRQGNDIATQQLPQFVEKLAGVPLMFDTFSGAGYPDNLSDYKLAVHCGACMLNRREMLARIGLAKEAQVPITNFGMLLAYVHGVMPRALEPFPEALEVYRQTLGLSNNKATIDA